MSFTGVSQVMARLNGGICLMKMRAFGEVKEVYCGDDPVCYTPYWLLLPCKGV